MSKIKKLALALLLAMPMVASAAGMGIYIPFNATETESIEYDDFTGTYDFEYKPSAGFGIAFDSNIGKDKLYNYRLGLEYSKSDIDNVNGSSPISGETMTKNKFNIVNTFGFGVLRTKAVRLWVGPRINIQFENGEYSNGSTTISQDSFGIGAAVAVGVNVNVGRVVSLAADLDYHAVVISGTEEGRYDYTGINDGVTARFYVLFRFGETFEPKSAASQDQGVIDQSL